MIIASFDAWTDRDGEGGREGEREKREKREGVFPHH
jgi:hypothetical protein